MAMQKGPRKPSEHDDVFSRSKTVLVVDDNSFNRRILRKIIETEYPVLEAENGAKALRLYEENRVHIAAIILDLVMPEMDGYEFLRRFAEEPQSAGVPVIVSTGQADDEHESLALELGA